MKKKDPTVKQRKETSSFSSAFSDAVKKMEMKMMPVDYKNSIAQANLHSREKNRG